MTPETAVVRPAHILLYTTRSWYRTHVLVMVDGMEVRQ